MKIYLVRHGEDEDNAAGILNGHRDKPLTKLGIEQSKKRAESIKKAGFDFDKIYSSPLQRAYQTAEIIAEIHNKDKPIVLEDLKERDFGIMTGKKVSEIETLCSPDIFKTDYTTYFLKVEKAETFPQLLQRAKSLLKWIQDSHSEGNILLVTHGDLGKMIYAAHFSLPWKEVLNSFHFKNSDFLTLK